MVVAVGVGVVGDDSIWWVLFGHGVVWLCWVAVEIMAPVVGDVRCQKMLIGAHTNY